MKTDKVNEAIRAAKEFIKRASMLEKAPYSDKFYMNGKDSASVKRASMDLTRALSNMRQESF